MTIVENRTAERPAVKAGGPVVFVVGGHGPDHLIRTVDTIGAGQIWCVVPDDEEAVAVAGLARVIQFDQWTGTAAALERLADEAGSLRDHSAVVIVRAGTRFRRGAIDDAVAIINDGAGVALPVASRGRRVTAGLRLRTQPRSRLIPPSGVAMSVEAFTTLRESGWVTGRKHATVREVKALAGPVRVRRLTKVAPHRRKNRGIPRKDPMRPVDGVTVVIPAHNEEEFIAATLTSIFAQTRVPDEVIVVDDGSTDRTGEIARSLGARVIRPDKRQGRKAAAVNVGLKHVRTQAVMIVDADTTLERHAINQLVGDLEQGYDATCGTVQPADESSLWARGRALQYALARRLFKPMQRDLRAMLVLSGCVSVYRTDALRGIGGLSDRTVGEDLDATWELSVKGGSIGFAADAVAYTVEPPTFRFYRGQIRRWASGLFQSLKVHRMRLGRRPGLALLVVAILVDLLTTPIGLVLIPVLWVAGKASVWWLIAPAIMYLITLSCGIAELGVRRAVRALPSFFVMIWTDLYFYLETFVREMILRRGKLNWEKGH